MIKIVHGNIEKVQEEMKQKAKEVREEISRWKKKQKEIEKAKQPGYKFSSQSLGGKIHSLETQLRYYQFVSRVVPVRIGKLIINLKGYQDYVKSLKLNPHQVIVEETQITVEHKYGRLELYDLSEWFSDFQHIPVAEIVQEGE